MVSLSKQSFLCSQKFIQVEMHKVIGEATPIVNDLQHEFTNEFFGSNQYYTDFQ